MGPVGKHRAASRVVQLSSPLKRAPVHEGLSSEVWIDIGESIDRFAREEQERNGYVGVATKTALMHSYASTQTNVMVFVHKRPVGICTYIGNDVLYAGKNTFTVTDSRMPTSTATAMRLDQISKDGRILRMFIFSHQRHHPTCINYRLL